MLYFISGLGANQQVFSQLDTDIRYQFLPWLEPYAKEGLRHYAERMAEKIDFTRPVTILGYSFGGIVAQEIARYFSVDQLILVSTAVDPKELQTFLSFQRYLRMHRWVPGTLVKNLMPFVAMPYFQPMSPSDVEVLKAQIAASSGDLIQWSIDKVLDWEGAQHASPIHRIHGTADKMFPIASANMQGPFSQIEGGGHFMLYNRAAEVSSIVRTLVQPVQG